MPQIINIPGHGDVEFPDTMDQAAIEAAARKLSGGGSPITEKSLASRASEWLPTAMGAGYSLAGKLPVAGAALSFLGGASGEGYRQAIEGGRRLMGGKPQGSLPNTMRGQFEAMGREGAIQAGSDVIGRGIGAGLTKAGGALYRKLLKPSLSAHLLPKAAQTAETGIEYGINPFAPKSLGRVEPEIARIGSEVEGMVGAPSNQFAGVSPGKFSDPRTIAARVQRVAKNFEAPGADPLDRAAAARVPQQFLDDLTTTTVNQVPLGPGLVDAAGRPLMKTVESKSTKLLNPKDILEARRATGRSAGGNAFGVTRTAETEARKELYGQLGEELGNQVPAVRPQMKLESRLIDLKDAATAASERARNQGLFALRHAAPAALGLSSYGTNQDPGKAAQYWLMAELASNPRILARTALTMARSSKPGAQAALSAVPRGFWQLARSSQPPTEQD